MRDKNSLSAVCFLRKQRAHYKKRDIFGTHRFLISVCLFLNHYSNDKKHKTYILSLDFSEATDFIFLFFSMGK